MTSRGRQSKAEGIVALSTLRTTFPPTPQLVNLDGCVHRLESQVGMTEGIVLLSPFRAPFPPTLQFGNLDRQKSTVEITNRPLCR